MFSKAYTDHFSNPRNVGDIESPDGEAVVVNEESGCFDKLRLQISIDNDIISKAVFRARACTGTIAVASALTEMIKDKEVAEAKKIDRDSILNYLGGIPENKAHSINLALKALNQVLPNSDTGI